MLLHVSYKVSPIILRKTTARIRNKPNVYITFHNQFTGISLAPWPIHKYKDRRKSCGRCGGFVNGLRIDWRCHAFSATVANVTSKRSVTRWHLPLVGRRFGSIYATAKKARGPREQIQFSKFLAECHSLACSCEKRPLFFVDETHGKSWSRWQCLFASLSLWLHCPFLPCRPARQELISSQQWKESGIMLQVVTTKWKVWSSRTTGRNKATINERDGQNLYSNI